MIFLSNDLDWVNAEFDGCFRNIIATCFSINARATIYNPMPQAGPYYQLHSFHALRFQRKRNLITARVEKPPRILKRRGSQRPLLHNKQVHRNAQHSFTSPQMRPSEQEAKQQAYAAWRLVPRAGGRHAESTAAGRLIGHLHGTSSCTHSVAGLLEQTGSPLEF